MSAYDNTDCIVCNSGDSENSLLLCDGCDRGFHIECINLAAVPLGNWFCAACIRFGKSKEELQVHGEKQELIPGSAVYLYGRVSSKNQNEPEYGRVGMQSQNATLLEFCIKNDLYVKGTVREVCSARNPENLEELNKLINKLRAGDVVIVYSVSRFSRNLSGGSELLKIIHNRGAFVHSVSDNCNSYETKFLELLKESQAESDRLSKRIVDAYKRMKQIGSHIGAPKFGWKVVRDPSGIRRLFINEGEETIIQNLKGFYRQGCNAQQVAEKLNNSGQYRRGKKWTAHSVLAIVRPFKSKTFSREMQNNLPEIDQGSPRIILKRVK